MGAPTENSRYQRIHNLLYQLQLRSLQLLGGSKTSCIYLSTCLGEVLG